jgi:outer membrane phospholipase A
LIEAPELPPARALVSVQTQRTSDLLAATVISERSATNARDRTPSTGINTAAPIKADEHERLLRRAVRAPLIPGISANEPVYFIVGYRPGLNARFQVSFKYQPFEATRLRHLGIAFTTTSVWDWYKPSLPFRDSTYRPSLSWYDDPRPFLGRKDLRLTWQYAAWEHESNGRGETNVAQTAAGSDSRSLNIGFVRPTLTWQLGEKDFLTAALKLYTYYDRPTENRDIDAYRGYADLQLRYLHDDWVFSTLLRKGRRGYSAEFNVGIPQNIFLSWFSPDLEKKNVHGWLLLQYLSGYGETLLDYNRRIPDQVRAGLMVVP